MTMPRAVVRPLLVVLLAALALGGGPAALAQGTPSAGTAGPVATAGPATTPAGPAALDTPAGEVAWGVRPADNQHGNGRANYAFMAAPGETIEDAIVVSNHADTPLTLRVYAADGFTTSSGLLDMLPADQPSTDLGTWVRLEVDSVRLEPGESREIAFTLTVPADARPGDHTGGVVTSLVTETSDANLSLDRRLASRVHVRVPGEMRASVVVTDLEVAHLTRADPFGPAPARVRFTLVNDGNLRAVVHGQATVSGPGGLGAVAGEEFTTAELLPGSTLALETEIDGVWPLVRVTAELRTLAEGVGVGGGAGDPTATRASTWAVPWGFLVVGALVAVVAIVVPRVLRNRAAARAD